MRRKLASLLGSRLGRIGIQLSAANYLQAALGFVVNFYLANKLGSEGYGLLSYGIVVGTIVYTIVNFAAERTLVRDLVQRPDRNAMLTSSLVLRGCLSVFAITVMGVFIRLSGTDPQRGSIVILCTLAALFWALGPIAWFDAHYRMHHHAYITLGEKLVYLAAVILIFCLGNSVDAVLVAAILMGTRLLSFIVQIGVVFRSYRPNFTNLFANVRWLVGENVFIVMAALSNLMISHWNQIVLDHRVSTRSLGYYSLAFQMVAVITLLQGQIIRLLFPRIAELTVEESDPELGLAALRRYILYAGAISAAIAVPLALVGPIVIRSFFRSDYMHALWPLRILCAWTVVSGMGRVINTFLVNLHMDRAFLVCSLLAGLAAVLLGQLLIPIYGASGVALALLIGHPISIMAQWLFVRRGFRKRRQAVELI